MTLPHWSILRGRRFGHRVAARRKRLAGQETLAVPREGKATVGRVITDISI